MTDMLSLVARAIAERNEPGIWDRPEGPPDEFWRDGYLIDAKAAIAAMRTPSEEMKGAGFKAGEHELWTEPGYHEGETLTYLNDEAPEIIWQAMIDKALEGNDEA